MGLGTGTGAVPGSATAFPSAGGALPNYLQPTQGKNLYAGNYLDFLSGSSGTPGANQWAQQFLPDVYDKEIEIYGNRTISGFLKMVSAEMPSSSDQIIWLEQGRLHARYTLATVSGDITDAGATVVFTAGGATGIGAMPTGSQSSTAEGASNTSFNFRVGQTVMIQGEGANASVTGTFKGIVVGGAAAGDAVSPGATVAISLYTAADAAGTTPTFTLLAYGSEYGKGTGNNTEKLDPSYSTYQNSPIIMKEHYAINGSDTGQIGWVEVTSENGASGYLWYVKAEHENRLRWEDYLEMAMVEGVYADASATTPGIASALQAFRTDGGAATTAGSRARGTEGFFAALEARGNVYQDLASDLRNDALATVSAATTDRSPTSVLAASPVPSFDLILKQMDKQGSIEENMLYVDRDLSLAFTDHLASINSVGNAMGTSYGIFNNSEDMALKLHFSGFRRGSYDFYTTDWKYLNDFSTRGGFQDIQGVLIPAGTSTVYDQNLGKNIKRPFLHVRYRSSETDNRKMKSWITGSVGGAYTTDIDEMRMHYLTERCLITQGANNFFLLQG